MPNLKFLAAFARGRLLDLPIKKKLYLILGLLIGDIVLIVMLGAFALDTLSSIRASVAAEDAWAKAVNGMVYNLGKYALFHEERNFQGYLEAAKVPAAYERANQELRNPSPDRSKLDLAFVEAGIHPDDVPGVSRLFVRFQHAPHVADAFRAWSKAQILVDQLHEDARHLRSRLLAGDQSKDQLERYYSQIDTLNDEIRAREVEFSSELGKASRLATRIFLWLIIGGSVLLACLTSLIAFYISGEIVEGVERVAAAAIKASEGDLTVRVDNDGKDELGKLAKAFNHMTTALGQLDGLKFEFFSKVSHELRTPLTLILSPAESLLLSQTQPLNPHQQTLVKAIHNNAIRLLQMVNGLLDFSKVTAQKVQVSLESVDIAALTKSVVEDFRVVMEEKGLRLEFEIDDLEHAVVNLDRYLYERILFNLLSNARKFTPSGGKISVYLTVRNDTVSVAVSDTGIGIAAVDCAKLFQRFHQVEGAASRRFEGTGLGLALVKEFAELLGGNASVVSELGTGSTFTVTCRTTGGLPSDLRTGEQDIRKALQVAVPLLMDVNVPLGPSDAPRILIAEDNPELRSFMQSLLRETYSTRVAGDGLAALEIAKEWVPDLILSDVMMPRLDGYALCRSLRSKPDTAHIPVVLISAVTHRDALLEGWEAGADDYLFKPFHPMEVLTRVRSLLRIKQAKDALEVERTKALRNAKLASLGELAAGIAHEINNPLTIIAGTVRVLPKFTDQPERLKEKIKVVESATERIAKIISSLRKFSRTSEAAVRKDHSLAQIVHEAIALTAAASRRYTTPIVVECRGDCRIACDEIEIEQVLINLINNAIDATKLMPERWIKIILFERESFVVVQVRDSGPGIARDVEKRMFQPFFTTKPINEGTGLGLSIAKGILDEHRATIEVLSNEPHTCFEIIFPRGEELKNAA